MKPCSQLQSCLASQLSNYAFGLLMFNKYPDVLPIYRCEIKLVGDIEICRNRFRIAIDHDGFVAQFFNCQEAVGTAVSKFNTLSDTVGTATQYNDLFLFRRNGFVL